VEELSEAEQKLYADACQLLKDSGATTATGSATKPIPSVPTPAQSASTDRVNLPHAVSSEAWITKKQWKLILAVMFLAAVAVALVIVLA